MKSQLNAYRAYIKGDVKGLAEYERNQLHKQGITDKEHQQTSNYNTTNSSRTIEAPISVEINNPQAWDTEHIQELSDKVPDQLSTAIVNAIGGDSNSY